ncbi:MULTISPECIES: LysR family transcriptional regulator [unclassified Bradyrhizobium]|uniref:LysR family transcriptional regulator n=1 Tax=unclassified Bradyrhizobium TaxID=2631580 RepID=UPI002478E1A8|nr:MULTISPECIES: LysR family transcriptional regulator [unclassified Bradyrhizobium]WGR73187.1 LysR family transcriptional regulator [Bradyrhizobium sp. ISRA426]WGR78026.1 LysR family transcriptional regulator [Bradyrhizobium sp. ISRA430]WGR88427.1 LysR family transcriptional regulator [Bradyrhizobium sp. ISRA432]
MRWRFDDIVTFIRVMEAGSITAAAARLNLSKSVISKRISDLEAALDAELFQRSTRQVRPTENGQAFYERMVPLLHEIDATAESLSSRRMKSLRGQLRLTTPMSFGTMYLGPVIAEFARRHPDLEVAIDYEDRHVDLIRGGYDVGIRIGHLRDSNLKARRLCECPRIVCCSPAYARQRGIPKSVDELVEHTSIDYAYVHATRFWQFENRKRGGKQLSVSIRSRIVANNGEAVRDMVLAGLGIAPMPMFLIARHLREGTLLPILQDAVLPPYTIAAIYPPTHHVSTKVRTFIDYLVEFFEAPLPWERDMEPVELRSA